MGNVSGHSVGHAKANEHDITQLLEAILEGDEEEGDEEEEEKKQSVAQLIAILLAEKSLKIQCKPAYLDLFGEY